LTTEYDGFGGRAATKRTQSKPNEASEKPRCRPKTRENAISAPSAADETNPFAPQLIHPFHLAELEEVEGRS